MRFNTSLARKYRKENGFYYAVHDTVNEQFVVYRQGIEGGSCRKDFCFTKSEAVKMCKELAMKNKYGFDKDRDIIMEESTWDHYSKFKILGKLKVRLKHLQ